MKKRRSKLLKSMGLFESWKIGKCGKLGNSENWKFENWDTFYLEKPFGKIFIEYGHPISFSKKDEPKESIDKLKKGMDEVENNNLYYANKK